MAEEDNKVILDVAKTNPVPIRIGASTDIPGLEALFKSFFNPIYNNSKENKKQLDDLNNSISNGNGASNAQTNILNAMSKALEDTKNATNQINENIENGNKDSLDELGILKEATSQIGGNNQQFYRLAQILIKVSEKLANIALEQEEIRQKLVEDISEAGIIISNGSKTFTEVMIDSANKAGMKIQDFANVLTKHSQLVSRLNGANLNGSEVIGSAVGKWQKTIGVQSNEAESVLGMLDEYTRRLDNQTLASMNMDQTFGNLLSNSKKIANLLGIRVDQVAKEAARTENNTLLDNIKNYGSDNQKVMINLADSLGLSENIKLFMASGKMSSEVAGLMADRSNAMFLQQLRRDYMENSNLKTVLKNIEPLYEEIRLSQKSRYANLINQNSTAFAHMEKGSFYDNMQRFLDVSLNFNDIDEVGKIKEKGENKGIPTQYDTLQEYKEFMRGLDLLSNKKFEMMVSKESVLNTTLDKLSSGISKLNNLLDMLPKQWGIIAAVIMGTAGQLIGGFINLKSAIALLSGIKGGSIPGMGMGMGAMSLGKVGMGALGLAELAYVGYNGYKAYENFSNGDLEGGFKNTFKAASTAIGAGIGAYIAGPKGAVLGGALGAGIGEGGVWLYDKVRDGFVSRTPEEAQKKAQEAMNNNPRFQEALKQYNPEGKVMSPAEWAQMGETSNKTKNNNSESVAQEKIEKTITISKDVERIIQSNNDTFIEKLGGELNYKESLETMINNQNTMIKMNSDMVDSNQKLIQIIKTKYA